MLPAAASRRRSRSSRSSPRSRRKSRVGNVREGGRRDARVGRRRRARPRARDGLEPRPDGSGLAQGLADGRGRGGAEEASAVPLEPRPRRLQRAEPRPTTLLSAVEVVGDHADLLRGASGGLHHHLPRLVLTLCLLRAIQGRISWNSQSSCKMMPNLCGRISLIIFSGCLKSTPNSVVLFLNAWPLHT